MKQAKETTALTDLIRFIGKYTIENEIEPPRTITTERMGFDIALKGVIAEATKLLPKEKKQIEDAWVHGNQSDVSVEDTFEEKSSEYFNQTLTTQL